MMLCFSKNVFSGVVGVIELDTAGVGIGCSSEGKFSAAGYWRKKVMFVGGCEVMFVGG